jgi:26S proteasome regulatory subunit T2
LSFFAFLVDQITEGFSALVSLALTPQLARSLLQDNQQKKYQPPAPPPRVGKKQKRRPGASALGTKLPTVVPTAKCKLRQLKLERIKDWLLMEEEYVTNQERLKPQEERNEEVCSRCSRVCGPQP